MRAHIYYFYGYIIITAVMAIISLALLLQRRHSLQYSLSLVSLVKIVAFNILKRLHY